MNRPRRYTESEISDAIDISEMSDDTRFVLASEYDDLLADHHALIVGIKAAHNPSGLRICDCTICVMADAIEPPDADSGDGS